MKLRDLKSLVVAPTNAQAERLAETHGFTHGIGFGGSLVGRGFDVILYDSATPSDYLTKVVKTRLQRDGLLRSYEAEEVD